MKTTEASFLIALPQLIDPNFQRAVILLIEHNKEGALGFIINRKSNVPLSEVLESPRTMPPKDLSAWIGGPVDTETGLILRPDPTNGFELTSSPDALEELIESASTKPQFQDGLYPHRFLIGYAGWGPGQLEGELRRGSWIEAKIDLDILFNCPWQNIWERTMGSLGCSQATLVAAPQPFLN